MVRWCARAISALLLLFSFSAFAASEAAQTFTLDGTLYDTNDFSSPLLDSSAQMKIQILDPSKSCVLYEEVQNVNTLLTKGKFNIQVGSNVGSGKRSGGNDPGHSMATVYQNISNISAINAGCGGGLYTPSPRDVRYVRISFTPTSSSEVTMQPDMVLGSQPSAIVAESVQGLDRSKLAEFGTHINANMTPANLLQLFDGSDVGSLHNHDSQYAKLNASTSITLADQETVGLGRFTNVQEAALTGGLNNTTDIGKTWYNSDTGKIMYWDGAGAVVVGAGGGSDNLGNHTATTALNMNSNLINNVTDPASAQDAATKNYVDGLITGLGTTYVAVAGDNMTGDLTMNAQGDVRFADAAGGEYAAIQAPATIGTNYTLTLPVDDGTPGQVLSTDGSGVLSWATAGGGADNLGNHTATTNIQLGANNISNDGGAGEGLSFDTSGNATFGQAVTSTSDITVSAQSDVRFADSAGGEYAAIQAPATIGTNYTLTLPVDDGTPSQVLTTDGSGVLSWTTPAGTTYTADGDGIELTSTTFGIELNGTTLSKGASGLSVNVGTGANQVVQLNASSELPAVDGSNLTGITASQVSALANVVEDTTPQLGGNLDVNGNNFTSAAGMDFAIGASAGNDFTVDTDKFVVEGDTGNIGIGTTSPDAKLAVIDNTNIITDYAAQKTTYTDSSTLGVGAGLSVSKAAHESSMQFSGSVSSPIGNQLDSYGGKFESTISGATITNSSGGEAIGVGGYSIISGSVTTSNVLRGIGVRAVAEGAVSGTGTTEHIGVLVESKSAATNNYGLKITTSGATNNYGLWVGALAAGANNYSIYSGALAQSYFAGSVGIGTATPNASALLDISSTEKGFLPPRMDTTQRNAISSPATGLTIYNIDNNEINFYNGTAWESVSEAGNLFVDNHVVSAGTAQTITTACGTYTDITGSSKAVNFPNAGEVIFNYGMGYYGSTTATAGRLRICIDASCGGDVRYFTNEASSHKTTSGSYQTTVSAGSKTIKLQTCRETGGNIVRDAWDSLYWNVVSAGVALANNSATDADGDTVIHVEESSDEDIIRFDTAGVERMNIDASGNINVSGNMTFTGSVDMSGATIADNSISVDDLDFASTDGMNIPQLTSDPSTPTAGQMYYNTTSNKLMVYNGSTWTEVGSASSSGGMASLPIGSIIAWHKDLTGVPTLPAGWVECNGATISDSDSPLNGQVTPDLNSQVYAGGKGRYLRGGTSSGLLNASSAWDDNGNDYSVSVSTPYYGGPFGTYRDVENSSSINNYSTSPLNPNNFRFQVAAMTVVYIIKTKHASVVTVLNDTDDDTKIQLEETGDEDTIRFDTAGSERMTINATGAVGIGTATPDASSLLDITSTDKGFLPPRMTTLQRNGISSPANGLVIYNIDDDELNYYNGLTWKAVGTGSGGGGSDVSFSVHKNSVDQGITPNAWNKITWSTEDFDTNNNFASDRFTPTVAGKYVISLHTTCSGATTGCYAGIFKNGTNITQPGVTGATARPNSTIIVEMNGTTDYLEGFVYNVGGNSLNGAPVMTNFTGALISGGSTLGDSNGVDVPTLASAPSSPDQGQMYYNTGDDKLYVWNGSAWQEVGSGASGGSGPSFSVNKGGTNQTGLSSGSNQKLTWSNELYDTNNNFSSDRFTPNVAGKYIISASVLCISTTSHCMPRVYKNGAEIFVGDGVSAGGGAMGNVSAIVDMNGTTDYLELYVYGIASGSFSVNGNITHTYFSGALIGGGSTLGDSNGVDIPTLASAPSSPDQGQMYYNTGDDKLYVWNGSAWQEVGSSSGGSPSAFNVHKNNAGSQTITTTAAKITWAAEDYDLNNEFDLSNNRFQPKTAGKYLLTATLSSPTVNIDSRVHAILKKNGTQNLSYTYSADMDSTRTHSVTITKIVDANGTSDYFEIFAGLNSGNPNETIRDEPYFTHFSGAYLGGSAAPLGDSNGVDVPTLASAPSSPDQGQMYYNTGDDKLYVWNGSSWQEVGSGVSGSSDVSFKVHKNGTAQTVTSGVTTKLTWSNEEFDTNNNFASDRFTPTVAGKYLFIVNTWCQDATTQCVAYIHKNGSSISQTNAASPPSVARTAIIVDMNGTTDYVEAFALNSGGTTIHGGENITYFTGSLISGGSTLGDSNGVDVPTLASAPSSPDQGQMYYNTGDDKLYVWNGSAWQEVGSGSGGTNSTIIPNFPDAITCTSGVQTFILYHTEANSGGAERQYFRIGNTGTNIRLNTSTGAFVASAGLSGYDCDNKSVSQLYANDLAFNFIGSQSGGGSEGSHFRADRTGGAAQSLANGSEGIVNFASEVFDTNSNFDPSTDRFTPTVAGAYILSACGVFTSASIHMTTIVRIKKNGIVISESHERLGSVGSPLVPPCATVVAQANGSTDYFEMTMMPSNSGGNRSVSTTALTHFSGGMLGQTSSVGTINQDADNDTKIQVEESSDEDIIRFDTAGAERMTINASGAVNMTGALTANSFTGDGSGLTNIGATAIADNSISVTDLDFASSNGINVPQQASAPGTPATGQMYYNTTENKLKVYNGSTWTDVGSSSGTVGLIGSFPTATCPTGWLAADGSAVSRTTYAALFTSISTMYGTGDGSTTFNLPDYRGQFLRGTDGGAGTDPDAASRTDRGDGTTGDNVGTKQADEFKSHSHQLPISANPGAIWGVDASSQGGYTGAGHDRSTGPQGGNETRPTNINVTYCISYAGGVSGGEFAADGSAPMTGNISLNGNYLSNDGGNEGIRIDDDGKVGIGTVSPDASLHVDGDIKMGNSSAICDASAEGSQRYNSTNKRMEFCDATNWRPVSSGVIQTVSTTNSTDTNITAGAGSVTVFSQAITPDYAFSKINLRADIAISIGAAAGENCYINVIVKRGSTTIETKKQYYWSGNTSNTWRAEDLVIDILDSPATTSAVTYSIDIDRDNCTEWSRLNNTTYGSGTSTMDLYEIVP